MIAGTFKLTNGTIAISEKDRKTVVLIPAGARVVVVDGDIEGDQLLKIRYQERVLLVRSAEFRDALETSWPRLPDCELPGLLPMCVTGAAGGKRERR